MMATETATPSRRIRARRGEIFAPRVRFYVTLVIALGGVGLRIAQYLFNRSLWLDEAMITRNILDKSFLEFFGPLDWGQGAPVGFLFIEKTVVELFGFSEYALRLWPLVAGIAAIFLLWAVMERIMPDAAPLAVMLLAFSDPMIYYSSEVKQYMSDQTVALALWLLVLTLYNQLRAEHPPRRAVLGLAAGGAIAVWFSHPAIFVLSGMGIVLIWQPLRQRDWSQVRVLVIIGAAWLASFGLVYLLAYRHTSAHEGLQNYWAENMGRLDPVWFLQAYFEMTSWAAGLWRPLLVILLTAGFVISLIKLDRRVLSLVLMPLVFTVLAALAHLYPFGGRLIFFTLPIVWITGCTGLTEVLKAVARDLHPNLAAAVIIGGAGLLAIGTDARQIHQEGRLAFEFIEQQHEETGAVYPIFLDVRMWQIGMAYDIDASLVDVDRGEEPALIDLPAWYVCAGDDVGEYSEDSPCRIVENYMQTRASGGFVERFPAASGDVHVYFYQPLDDE